MIWWLEVALGLVAFGAAVAWISLRFFCHSREWRAMEKRGREYLKAMKRNDARLMAVLDRRRTKDEESTKPNPTRRTTPRK